MRAPWNWARNSHADAQRNALMASRELDARRRERRDVEQFLEGLERAIRR